MEIKALTENAISLLKELIETPSFSTEEAQTAVLIENWFTNHSIPFHRTKNNVWATNKYFDESKPTLLLNSHHDTVKPNTAYTKDPFKAIVEDGKLYGLGSNDAGGCLVSLIATFTHFYAQKNLSYNLVIVASAEEENSGKNGLNSMLPIIPHIDVAIVGEPTLMQLAVAEKGLVVFDAEVAGTPSHAAHPNTNNAIYNSIEVLQWFQNFKFKKTSKALGDVKMTVTQIAAGFATQRGSCSGKFSGRCSSERCLFKSRNCQHFTGSISLYKNNSTEPPVKLLVNFYRSSARKSRYRNGQSYLWIPNTIRSSSIIVPIAKIRTW